MNHAMLCYAMLWGTVDRHEPCASPMHALTTPSTAPSTPTRLCARARAGTFHLNASLTINSPVVMIALVPGTSILDGGCAYRGSLQPILAR